MQFRSLRAFSYLAHGVRDKEQKFTVKDGEKRGISKELY